MRLDKSASLTPLSQFMKEEKEFSVRQKAIEGLGELDRNDSTKAFLLKCLREDADQGVRAMAADRLSIVGDVALLPDLETCLAVEQKMYVLLKIVEASGKIGGARALELLRAIATKDKMPRVRKAALSFWKEPKGAKNAPTQTPPKAADPEGNELQVDDF